MFENSFGKILKSAFKILNNKKLKVFPQRKKTKKKNYCSLHYMVVATKASMPDCPSGHHKATRHSWWPPWSRRTFLATTAGLPNIHCKSLVHGSQHGAVVHQWQPLWGPPDINGSHCGAAGSSWPPQQGGRKFMVIIF